MNPPNPASVLNRVLGIVEGSFCRYMRFAKPYVTAPHAHLVEVFAGITADLDAASQRLRGVIDRQGAIPRAGNFSIDYSSMHDVAIECAARQAVVYQRRDIERLRQLADCLPLAPATRSVVEEAVGMAKAHLQSLEEALAQPLGTVP